MKIEWDETFSVGVDEIDRQHKEFIRIINRLQWLEERRSPQEQLIGMAQELWRYAEFHFCSEENLMRLFQYPDQEDQEEEHKRLVKTLKVKIHDLESGRGDAASLSEFAFIWLKTHTTTLDKKIGQYIQNLKP
jgi:hemerythrin